MKILFVTPMLCYPGVPYAGEASIFKLMESLSKLGFEVFVITGLRPGEEKHIEKVRETYTILEAFPLPWSYREIVADIGTWCLSLCRGGLTFRKKAALSVQKFAKEIDFDIIQVEHSDLGAFMRKTGKVPMIISAVDVLFKPLQRKYLFFKNWKKVFFYFKYIQKKRYELRLYARFEAVFTWSQYDKTLLKKNSKGLNIFVTKPFVNIPQASPATPKRDPSTILFSGAMNRPDNIRAALFLYENIFKLVQRDVASAMFYIVGNSPPESIKTIGEKNQNVIVTGYVKSMEPFFSAATVFVSPIFFGGGIIVKNLDAMGRGLPVVTTPVGNEGSGAVSGKDIITAETAESFAMEVIRLLRDKRHWRSISENGANFIKNNFNWDKTVTDIVGEYKRLKKQ